MKKLHGHFFVLYLMVVIFVTCLLSPNLKIIAAQSTNYKGDYVRAAFFQDMPPYQYTDAAGHIVGMHIDILNRISEKQNFQIKYIPMSTKDACFNALKNDEVDIILGANITSYYNSYLPCCTSELSSSEICLIANKKISNQYSDSGFDKEYTVVNEYGIGNNYLFGNLRNGIRTAVGDQVRAFDLIKNGEAQLMIGDKNSILHQIYEAHLNNEYTVVHNYLGTVSYTIVVHSGNKELLRSLDDGLASIRYSGEYEKLSKKWLINEQEHHNERIIKGAAIGTLIIICIGLIYLYASRRTKKRLERCVNEQSQELINVNKKLAQRLKTINHHNELLNSLIEKSPVGIILFEHNHNISLMNASACSLSGVRSDKAANIKIDDIPVFGDILRANNEDFFKLGYEMKGKEFEFETNGQRRNYDCSLFQLITNGVVSSILMWVNDITQEISDRNEHWEQKKHSILNRMIAGIAHEIKNPLTAISAFTSLIKTQGMSSKFLSAFEQFVPAEVERINKLIENLLDYARVPHAVMQKVNVKEICINCAMMISAIAEKSKIKIDIEEIEDAQIVAAPDQLKQMLINIMMNGLESMQAKLAEGCTDELTLKISSVCCDDKVCIRIRDQGKGMSREQIEMSTEPFYTTKANSSGLGLAMTSQYAKLNGAKMSIKSMQGNYTETEFCFDKYTSVKGGGKNETRDANN